MFKSDRPPLHRLGAVCWHCGYRQRRCSHGHCSGCSREIDFRELEGSGVPWFTGVLQSSLLAQLSGAHDALGEQRRKALELLAPPPSRHRDRPRQFVRIAVADWF
jgi:hypothetical protein